MSLCQWRVEVCIHAEGDHFEQLLWRCLPDIQVATYHNRLFSEPPTFGGKQYTIRQMNEICISQGSVGQFSGVTGKFTITVRFILRQRK